MDNRKSYWDGNGKYQDAYNIFESVLVPSRGEASEEYGEAIRCCGRLFYDYCNNGNGNVLDIDDAECGLCWGGYEEGGEVCPQCDGEGRTNDGVIITPYYMKMIAFLQAKLGEDKLHDLLEFLKSGKDCTFDQSEMDIYNKVVDSTIEWIVGYHPKHLVMSLATSYCFGVNQAKTIAYIGDRKLVCVVKANGYGHGALEISKVLSQPINPEVS